MQPFQGGFPMGDVEMVEFRDMQRRLSEMVEAGADEVRIYAQRGPGEGKHRGGSTYASESAARRKRRKAQRLARRANRR